MFKPKPEKKSNRILDSEFQVISIAIKQKVTIMLAPNSGSSSTVRTLNLI